MSDDRLREILRPPARPSAPSFDAVLRRRPRRRRVRRSLVAIAAVLLLAPLGASLWPEPPATPSQTLAINLPTYTRSLEAPFDRTRVSRVPPFSTLQR